MRQKKMRTPSRLTFAEDLIENLPIGMMILDQNGKIIRMNKKQEETSQVERERIIGRTFQEVFTRTLEQGLKESYFKLLRYGTSFDVIIDRYVPQYYSKQMTYHARGSRFSSKKYFILLHELEEELYQEKRLVEKRTKELQESKNLLESLIDFSPVIVISTDFSGRILIFNKKAEKTFGYSKEDVMGKKINILFKNPPSNRGDRKDRTNSVTPREVICIKNNQSIFPCSSLVTDIKDSIGKTIAKLYLLSDLTEKKEMEERLLLIEKLAVYSELMGGIAHQLNNPLIGVVNFSEMLLKQMDEEDPRRELTETISKAGKECLKIITSILNCITDPNPIFMKTNIHEVLRNSIHSLKEQFGEKLEKISIRTTMDPNMLPIMGDEIQLKQCFLNILTNAVQAMQNGGSLRINTEYDEQAKQVKIVVADNGTGIPKEFLEKIFLPFFSIKKSRDRHGLGLSFAYQIIKNHGGYVNVESEEGLGSTFTVVLSAG